MVQQNGDKTYDCIEKYCEISRKCRKNQIRSIKLHVSKTKGLVATRFLSTTLYRGEEFYLQIDAHSKLKPNWDVLLFDDWEKTNYDRAVLSTHPIAHTNYYKSDYYMTNLCDYYWEFCTEKFFFLFLFLFFFFISISIFIDF